MDDESFPIPAAGGDDLQTISPPAAAPIPNSVVSHFPELLTENEAIRYLRLDTIQGLKNPGETLARYRANGLLRGTQVSKCVFYRRIELDRFLDRLTNENPR